MSARRRVSAFVVALSFAAAPRAALAFSTSRLEYDLGPGAEDCPAEPVVRASVADRLGYDPFVESATRTIVVRIGRAGERLEASVELVDALGTRQGLRQFSAAPGGCAELVSALALSISIAVDPERAQQALDRAEAAPASEPPTPKIERRKPPPRLGPPPSDSVVEPPIERHARRPALRWQLGAGGHAAIGSAPSATGGAFVFFGARLDSVSLSLEGRADFPASKTVAEDAAISTQLFLLSAVPCWEGKRMFACALLAAGSLRANGTEIASPGDDTGFYAAAGARLGTTVELYDPLELRMSFDFLTALTQPTLQIDDQEVWRVPRFSGAGGLGLLAHFP